MAAPAPGLVSDAKWFERTGHCGACGQPGEYCLCRRPCGCAGLHEVGSGLSVDAVDVFATSSPDQDVLF